MLNLIIGFRECYAFFFLFVQMYKYTSKAGGFFFGGHIVLTNFVEGHPKSEILLETL